MENTTGSVLKSDAVKVEGTFNLGAESAATATATATSPNTPKANPGSVKTQASIIENNPEFVLIELTCSCGTKTHVKCQYADAGANAAADADTQPPTEET